MRATPDDMHGNVPDDADVALLLIDVINDLEFDGGVAVSESSRSGPGRSSGDG